MISNNVFIKRPSNAANVPGFNNRNIPEPIKREIRQRCGFGCVICGAFIYDFDHMLQDWAQVREHVANDITLLCPNHHREKTNGLMTRTDVKDANENPCNIDKGVSRPYELRFSGDTGIAVIAGNHFTNDGVVQAFEDRPLPYVIPILIDSTPIIGFKFQDERLLLNIIYFDEFNRPIFQIIDNQLIFKPDIWDIELRGARLKIREKPKSILLDLKFSPPNKIVILNAKIRLNGVELDLKKDHFVLNGEKSPKFQGNVISSLVGISIGPTGLLPRGFIDQPKVDRYRNS